MDFGLDEAQRELAASARKVVSALLPAGRMAHVLENPEPIARDFWAQAAELGWLGLLADEARGGAGLGPLELVALQEELGRGLVPGPFLSSAVLATAALNAAGERGALWLDRLVSGRSIGCVALPEAPGGAMRCAVEAVRLPGGGIRISGRQAFVLGAASADVILVAARVGGGPDGDMLLVAVERTTRGLTVTRHHVIDPTRELGEVLCVDVEVGPAAVLAEAGAQAILRRVADLGRVALCAEMVGGADRVLEMCVDYAGLRVQFGRPIGAFQAIQHKCADVLLGIETARAATLAAATSLVHGDADASLDASIAKAYACDVYRRATTEAVQIHGALGFTWDLDVQAYFKRAKASETLLGDARANREAIARHVIDGMPDGVRS